MKQRVRDVSVLNKNLNTWIVCVCLLAVVPVFCTLTMVTTTNALSLRNVLSGVTAPVTNVLPVTLTGGAPAQAPVASSPSPASARQTSTAPQPAAVSSSAPLQTSQNVAPMQVRSAPVSTEPLAPLPVLAGDIQLVDTPYRQVQLLAVAPYTRAVQPQTSAFLQPSAQGWRLGGVAWYWWVVAVAGVWVAFYQSRRLLRAKHSTAQLIL